MKFRRNVYSGGVKPTGSIWVAVIRVNRHFPAWVRVRVRANYKIGHVICLQETQTEEVFLCSLTDILRDLTKLALTQAGKCLFTFITAIQLGPAGFTPPE